MSRINDMSAEAIRAVFSAESDSDLYMLLTIYDKNNVPIIELCDGFNTRLTETATEVTYGVVSRNKNYIFIPMNISLPTEESAQVPRCQITLQDVTRFATPIIRSIDYSPRVLLELVLSKKTITNPADPNFYANDTVGLPEASFTDFYVTGVTYNANTVVFELNMIDYNREPFPQYRFSPAYFPGMF